ncbi:MAG TPA: S9 family peptidase [Candidatus Eisenbacteria bacterium]|nr:S9 family peptidase [Candidatus Eisenbacteria bacterium]
MTASLPRSTPPTPPVARRVPHVTTLHGERREDDYFWLREKSDPEVIAYLEAENAYAEAAMSGTAALQERLYQEMLSRIQQTDLSVPYLEGGYFYYSRTEEGQQYPIQCRKRGSIEAPEQVVLDLNQLARGEAFMALGAFEVSDDGALLAYSTDRTGFRVYDLHVRDLHRGADLADTVHDVGSVAWAADGRTLFYTVKDAAKRDHRLYRRRLGESQSELVYEEPDERFVIHVDRSRSGAWLFLSSDSHTTSEVRVLRADDPAGAWRVISERRQDHEYGVDHRGDSFYILTNDHGRNFRLVVAPVDDPSRWTEMIPPRDDVMLEGLACFQDHLVVSEREDGLVRLRIHDFRSQTSHRIEFPEPVYAAGFGDNRTFATTKVRYVYQSFITPPSTFDYDVDARTSALLKRQPVLGGYEPALYESRREHALAADGTRVPISIVWRRDTARPAPLLLYAYGAYGMSMPASFNSNRFSLLDRGVVFAIAHVRGGGELGKAWHDRGRMAHKQNTFDDFIAAAEHLIASGWTAPDRLAIHGGSAGGLTMAAVINRRPELFHAALLAVPFVDVINTMCDESLPLTVGEYEEWGNPSELEHYQVIRTYCPYTNLAPRDYPRMLVKASLHDSQVMVWEPAKYVARLRTLKQDGNPLLFKVNLSAGHGGASGRYDFLREIAFDYAFLLSQWGLQER